MIDALDYFAPKWSFAQENHLVSPNNPLYGILEPGKIWYPKSVGPNRMPADLDTYDENFIYQKLTENSWTNPVSFKAFVSSNWLGGGIPFCPRYLIDDTPRLYGPWVTPDSSFRLYTSCTTFTESNLGTVQTQAFGPILINLGSQLGILGCIIVQYQWSNGTTLETFMFAEGYGWVGWTTANLLNSVYVTQQTSLFNTIAAGGSAGFAPFPCVIP